jgi:hypothetical protein
MRIVAQPVPFAQLGEPQVDQAFAQGDALGLGRG